MTMHGWRPLRSVAALVFVASLLGIAGCGDSGSSREDVADEVNGICADVNAEFRKLDTSNLEEIGTGGKKGVTAFQKGVRELKGVEVSGEVKDEIGDDYTRFVDTYRDLGGAWTRMVSSAGAKDTAAFKRAGADFNRVSDENDRYARKLGFDECLK